MEEQGNTSIMFKYSGFEIGHYFNITDLSQIISIFQYQLEILNIS